ncbi:MAG: TVP38/TMEM64 family protein [Pseudomonadota bacterium]
MTIASEVTDMTPNDGPSDDVTTRTTKEASASGSRLKRFAPLIAIVGLMALVFAMGWHKYLSLQTIGENYGAMQDFIAANFVLALAVYMAAYVAVVALSLPGGLIMTLTGGLLFGPYVGIPATVLAATLGATLIFLIAKSSLGETLSATAGPWLDKLKAGFRENALSYMLFLRLVPAFPFVVVNLAPAFLGVPLRTYFFGTLFGIIPGTSAYSLVGASLGAPLEAENARHAGCVAENGADACSYSIDLAQLVSRELIYAGIALAIVALIPIVVKRFRKEPGRPAGA